MNSLSHNDVPAGLPPISLTKKICFAALVTVAFFACLECALWLAGAKTDFAESDRYAGFVSHVPHFVESVSSVRPTRMVVAPHKRHVLNDLSFYSEKSAGTFRIVCLGGSSTFGRPFFDQTSFPGWLRLWLPAAAPSQKWEVINAGAISYASYREVGLMEELANYQPDLFILYVGQNEFLERRTYDDLLKQPAWLREITSLAGHTRTASLVRKGLEGVGALSPPAAATPALPGEVKSIPVDAVGPEAYHRDDAVRREVVAHFEQSLERMLAIAANADARVMLIVPASNLADFAPFKSEAAAELSPAETKQWQQHFAQALKLTQQAKLEDALAELDAAAAIDDRRADPLFARGQLLMRLGRDDEAATALRRAKDEDICPLRATEPLLEAVRHAADSPAVLSVDLDDLLSLQAANGIPGKAQFHDHVHLTIEANQILAAAIIEVLAAAGISKIDPTWSPQIAEQLATQYQAQWDRPQMARELLRLASLLISLKQQVMAIEQVQAALAMSGESSDIADAAGKLLDQIAGGRVTLRALQEFVVAHPQSAAGESQLGIALLKRKQAQAALAAFERALAINPNSQEALHFAGLLQLDSGNLPQAETNFRHLVAVAPQLASGHENLAKVLEKQGNHEEAGRQWELAKVLKPPANAPAK